MCPLNRGVQRATRRATVESRESDRSSSDRCGTARLVKALPAMHRVSAIASAGQEPAVQLVMQRPCTQLCVSGVGSCKSVWNRGFCRFETSSSASTARPLGSLREKKATGALPSSGLGFSLPWRFTDTVAHPENLFCAHTLRVLDKQNKKINRTHTFFETHVSHIFRFFSLSCEHQTLKLTTISGQHSDSWERGD